ncbi:MAG: glycerophosphodiester phosphodiesterase [Acidimicrobiaceae bacterium]|nr:glycerophosphodiester phosphodiesterase [Acidimicrobiaceae bacterium]
MTSIFAHRGHHSQWLENSVAAVASAAEIGADGVEIDVWLTTDKHLVVHHDRIREGRDVAHSTRDQLEGDAPIATLGDVLQAAGQLRINVEIKSTRSPSYNLAVARAVAQYLDASPASSECLVSSFSLAICDEVRRVAPARKVGWLVTRQPSDAVLNQVAASRLTSAHFPFARVNRGVVHRAAALGVELHVWTPNLERDIDRMFELGVGTIITDEVPLAMALRSHLERATDQ